MRKEIIRNCPFCNKYICDYEIKNSNDIFMAKSKRNTTTYFHGSCFDIYRKIGFNPIESEVDDGK